MEHDSESKRTSCLGIQNLVTITPKRLLTNVCTANISNIQACFCKLLLGSYRVVVLFVRGVVLCADQHLLKVPKCQSQQ